MAAERDGQLERVEVEIPLDFAFQGVVRMIVGGVAEQASFGFEAMDDLQLAIERLLAEAGEEERVKISFDLDESGVRARVGPLAQGPLTAALTEPDADGDGTLSLARILAAVVDSFGVEPAQDGQIVVRLEKLGPLRP